MVLRNTVNRLGIYFFYDQDGIVDEYVTYLIDDLMKSLSKLIVVCNGQLANEGKILFGQYTEDIIVRENKGLDVWAYKTALDYEGWDNLAQYDEIVLVNSTIMGPVYPFAEMFESMNKRDVDFWGITTYGEENFDPFGCNPYGYIPEHIQSHFMAYRKSLVSSYEFKEYWKNMPEIHSYDESVGLHESAFTKRFSDMGFSWDVYVNTEDYKSLTTYPLIFYPKELIEKKRCPIFKRRSFFQDYNYVMLNTTGQPTMELYEYLKSSNLYDVRMIWKNILRTCNQADIAKNMQLNYIVSTKNPQVKKQNEESQNARVASVMHLYFPDLLEDSLKWASAMPEDADIYITTNTEEKKVKIEKVFQNLRCNKLEVRVIENRGRDVSSLLIGVKDVINNYDYICFVHDKKTTQIKPGSVGEGFAYKCFKNVLYNKTFVKNVFQLFEDNPSLGLLSPPVPNHADLFSTLGNEWSTNFEATKELAAKIGITVPMDEKKEHLAPLGTMFWFRVEAMKPLYAYNWKYSDFPQEPNTNDGSILHAVERLYPFVVQQTGFYPATIMADEYARIEMTNLSYYLRNYNRILRDNNICNYHFKMCEDLKAILQNITGQEELERITYMNSGRYKSDKEYIHALETKLNDMYESTSWKISKPVRVIGEFVKSLKRKKNS